jgi:hypothetical protein
MGWRSKNLAVRQAAQRRMRQTPGHKRRMRRAQLRLKFGITDTDYEAMFDAQKGLCQICGKADTRRLAVDHDHDRGFIRDLLCLRCNAGIGLLGDDPDRLLAAVAYLRAWGK